MSICTSIGAFSLCAAIVHPVANMSMASVRALVANDRNVMKTPRLSFIDSQIMGSFGAQKPSAGAKSTATLGSRKKYLDLVTARIGEEKATDAKSKTFNFKFYLAEKAKAVNEALDAAVPLLQPKTLTEAMRFALLAGGKRLRPGLCVAACELVGGTQEIVMPTACALEMIHTMSLMHDDMPCMENNDTRREISTIHKKFGENIALMSADALLSTAFEHIARHTKGVDANLVVSAIAKIGKAVGSEGLAAGQVVDLMSELDSVEDFENFENDLDVLEYIHIRKRALLLEASAVCGALIGGASEEEIERLGRYARYVGLYFQLVVDILDATKTSEQLEKRAGKVFLTDKTTYPKILGMDKAMELALDLKCKAKAELSVFDQEKAAPLLGLVDYIAQREN